MPAGGQAGDEALGGRAAGPGGPDDPAPGPQRVAALLIAEAAARNQDALSLAGLGLERLPGSLRAMTGLSRLDLSANRLTELPEWIGALVGIESLLLGGNLLMQLPGTLVRLERLAQLDVSRNRLVEFPAEVAVLPRLSVLDLSGNRHLLVPPPNVVRLGSDAVLAFLRGQAVSAVSAEPSPPVEAERDKRRRQGRSHPRTGNNALAAAAAAPGPDVDVRPGQRDQRPASSDRGNPVVRGREPEVPQPTEGDRGLGAARAPDDQDRGRADGGPDEASLHGSVPNPVYRTPAQASLRRPQQRVGRIPQQQAPTSKRQEVPEPDSAPEPNARGGNGAETIAFAPTRNDAFVRTSELEGAEEGRNEQLRDGHGNSDSDGGNPGALPAPRSWPMRRTGAALAFALLVGTFLAVALTTAAGGGNVSPQAVRLPTDPVALAASPYLESVSASPHASATATPRERATTASAKATLSGEPSPVSDASLTSSSVPVVAPTGPPADLAGLKPVSLAAAFDNVGITQDGDTSPGNFDGNDSSFSQNALDNAGASPGASVHVQGIDYTFPDVSTGTHDNTVVNGQVIALSGKHSELGVLLADDYGSIATTATVYYTDGSTQQISLVGQDWFDTTPPTAAGSTIALQTPYVNLSGDGSNDSPVCIVSDTFALDPAKTLYAVQLPALGPMAVGSPSMHIFAVATS